MALFSFGKKEEKVKEENCCGNGACNCNCECTSNDTPASANGASIKILGSGCTKCNDLEANVRLALEELGMDTTMEHVTDFGEIAAFGVMSTPALVVDGKVVSYGKVLKVAEVVTLLQKIR